MNKCNHPRHFSTGNALTCNIYLQSMSKEQVLAIADSKTSNIAKNINETTFNNLYKKHYENSWVLRKLLIAPLILKRTILTTAYVAFCIFMSVIFAPACTLTFFVISLFKTLVNIPKKGLQKSWEDQMKGFRSRELKIILDFYSVIYQKGKPTLWELGIILAHLVLLFKDREGLKLIQRLTLIKDSYDKDNIIKMFNCYEASKNEEELSIKDRALFTLKAFQLGEAGYWSKIGSFVEAVYDKNFKDWELGNKTTEDNQVISANYIIKYFNEILPQEPEGLKKKDEKEILCAEAEQLRCTYLARPQRHIKIDDLENDPIPTENDPISTTMPEKNFRQTLFSSLSTHVTRSCLTILKNNPISDEEGANIATLVIKARVVSYEKFDDKDLVRFLGNERTRPFFQPVEVIEEETLRQREEQAFRRTDLIFKKLNQHEKNYYIALFQCKNLKDHARNERINALFHENHKYTKLCQHKGLCFYEKLVSYLLPEAPLGLVFDKKMNNEIWNFFFVYCRNGTFKNAPKDIKVYILSLLFTATFNNPQALGGVHAKLKAAVKFPELKKN